MFMEGELYAQPADDILETLGSSREGLSSSEASARLASYGPNVLTEGKRITPFHIFVQQFTSFLTIILIFAAIISIGVGELSDAVLIIVILLGNALLGFFQEYKAEQALESLKEYLSLSTPVIRDGRRQHVDAKQIVPGDIVVLEAGDTVPADARILEASNVSVDESMLTGESLPAEKHARQLPKGQLLADQRNMAFMGTNVVRGTLKGIVVETGMGTAIGSIATLIDTREQTYFQKKLDALAKMLGKAVMLIALVVFALGVYSNEPIIDMVLISLSLAVAAIPEGLPAVVTITLSIGVRGMARLNAIVKRLPAAETLGSCTVICSDKTGTITKNKMTVRSLYIPEREVSIDEASPDMVGMRILLETGLYCNTASLEEKTGDPTEIALLDAAKRVGVTGTCERVSLTPFDSDRKRMSVTCRHEDGLRLYCKGAPEEVLAACDRVLVEGTVLSLTDEDRARIINKNDDYASRALRVLACAYRPTEPGDDMEEHLIFVGLQAMIDPPKEGVKEALHTCRRAGIRVIMITGDHALTAQAIAEEVGIYEDDDLVITGHQLEAMNEETLSTRIDRVSVFARVNPEHKLRIVEMLRRHGHVIAMTGDGVNDAPALKSADIGIAMNSGTDVSKDAADMILLDDNFTTIVNSVKEGRHIFDNIRKFVRYLLSTNFGEVFTIFLASIVGFPLPLLAVQILWINLLTDGLPALALAFEPREKGVMERPPNKPHENIVDRIMSINIAYTGLIMALVTLALYDYVPQYKAMTYAFTTLVLFQLFNVFNCRSTVTSVFTRVQNKLLIGAVAMSFVLQLAVIYIKQLNEVFSTVPLSLGDWALMAAATSSIVIVEEIRKRLGIWTSAGRERFKQ